MKKILKTKFIIIAILFISVFSIFIEVMFLFNDTEYIITVTDKERITDSLEDNNKNYKISSKYLVFADDENGNSLVFENTDCFIRGKFNSSNIQGQLKEGNTYRVTVIGYRIPYFSCYQNIIKVEEVLVHK